MRDGKVYKFKQTYSCKKLLENHTLSEYGVWSVHGEDPNCDLHGSHVEPLIGNFEGTLQEVIELVVELPKFWTWGAGGRIEKLKEPVIVKVADIRREQSIRERALSKLDEEEKKILGLS